MEMAHPLQKIYRFVFLVERRAHVDAALGSFDV